MGWSLELCRGVGSYHTSLPHRLPQLHAIPSLAFTRLHASSSQCHRHASPLLSLKPPSMSIASLRLGTGRYMGASVWACEASDDARPSPVRPSPAEAARTLMEVCNDGTLCTLSRDGWPLGTALRFALDADGRPFFHLTSVALHSRHLLADSRCSLHVQLEQPGRQRPQCTLKGRVSNVTNEKDLKRMRQEWDTKFGSISNEGTFFILNVDEALQSQDVTEEEVWVPGPEYYTAIPDPLRDCAFRIVEDMNKKHWDDIHRFCTVYTDLDVKVEKASLTWVDRLGFDLRVLVSSPEQIIDIRVPFPREVNDERDARSSLTMMAQLAWEHERHYSSSDLQLLSK